MNKDRLEIVKIIKDYREQAKSEINKCMHPNCSKKSIKSHIMQKNGILSSISTDRHLWELSINHFQDKFLEFKRVGINNIYTFLGFCNEHDTNLFKKIESKEEIDFNDYESCLLLALRTACNEYRLKEINIRWTEYILNNDIEKYYDKQILQEEIIQNQLGLKDLDFYIQEIWNDLQNKTQSFVFYYRKMEKLELCLNSIYTYDTSLEMRNYRLENGEDMERTSEIFISFFPYNSESVLLMGYHKFDESKVKSFVNLFFKENEKRVKRRISSLIIFNCETWVCSKELYHSKFIELDSEFYQAITWSFHSGNERKTFNINIYDSCFRENFIKLVRKL